MIKLTNHKNDIFIWKLRTYVDSDEKRILAHWYSDIPMVAKARFQVRVWYLLQQERDNWTRPQFDTLSEDAPGFGEIRMGMVNNVATRLIGYFDHDSFCVLLIVTKKGAKYDPSNWVRLSQERKLEIQKDPRRANEWIPRIPMGEPEE